MVHPLDRYSDNISLHPSFLFLFSPHSNKSISPVHVITTWTLYRNNNKKSENDALPMSALHYSPSIEPSARSQFHQHQPYYQNQTVIKVVRPSSSSLPRACQDHHAPDPSPIFSTVKKRASFRHPLCPPRTHFSPISPPLHESVDPPPISILSLPSWTARTIQVHST